MPTVKLLDLRNSCTKSNFIFTSIVGPVCRLKLCLCILTHSLLNWGDFFFTIISGAVFFRVFYPRKHLWAQKSAHKLSVFQVMPQFFGNNDNGHSNSKICVSFIRKLPKNYPKKDLLNFPTTKPICGLV